MHRDGAALGWHDYAMVATVDPNTASARFIVACLCAEWCSSCREYRATFDQVAREFGGVRFLWIDVEDQAALVDGIDVDNFPTVLIASSEGPLFLGPLTPQPDILVRLVRAHLAGKSRAFLYDRHVSALLERLRLSTSD